MKLKIMTINRTETGTVSVPKQFSEEVRPDLIKRAVLSLQSANRQPYGASPEAGMRHSAELSRRRRKYRGSYGHGISRIPRKILSRRGTRMNWVGAIVPGTVGGRRAHPPKAEKIWEKKINDAERMKATRSALAATLDPMLVSGRGHRVCKDYPFIIEDKMAGLKKTSDVKKALLDLGFKDELERISPGLRAGRGKMRGRKNKTKSGPLVVVAEDCDLQKSAANIPGVDVVRVDKLNAELLAPGTHPGRLCLFTQGALEILDKNDLFAKKTIKGAVKARLTKTRAKSDASQSDASSSAPVKSARQAATKTKKSGAASKKKKADSKSKQSEKSGAGKK